MAPQALKISTHYGMSRKQQLQLQAAVKGMLRKGQYSRPLNPPLNVMALSFRMYCKSMIAGFNTNKTVEKLVLQLSTRNKAAVQKCKTLV